MTRSYPLFSACGLNCGLCGRHHTQGVSRCPGCAGDGFDKVHPACGVLSRCQKNGHEYCFLCPKFPCGRYGDDEHDSFISYKSRRADMAAAAADLHSYKTQLDGKVDILMRLIRDYDDGRRKGYFCLAANVLSLRELEKAAEKLLQAKVADLPPKERAQAAKMLLDEAAEKKGISLSLRKKRAGGAKRDG